MQWLVQRLAQRGLRSGSCSELSMMIPLYSPRKSAGGHTATAPHSHILVPYTELVSTAYQRLKLTCSPRARAGGRTATAAHSGDTDRWARATVGSAVISPGTQLLKISNNIFAVRDRVPSARFESSISVSSRQLEYVGWGIWADRMMGYSARVVYSYG